LIAEAEKLGGNAEDASLARTIGHFVYCDPNLLKGAKAAIKHIHGKFYEMTDEYREFSIPYDRILTVLAEMGYDGYISSEYEGNRHVQDAFPVDSVEQVRRHQRMLSELTAASQPAEASHV
jgi:hypothetical protein